MRGQSLLKASLDALGLPAPAGACGPHICPSSTGVCVSVWAHRCELGRACVGMRVHAWARARSTRACDAACLCSCEGHSRAKHRPLYQPASNDTQCAHRCIVQLWRTQVEHAHGCVAWAHLHLCVLDQLEYKELRAVKRASDSAGARIECHQPRGPLGHLLTM